MKKFMICLFAAVAALGVMATANTSELNVSATCDHSHETCVTSTEATTHVESEGFGRCLKSGCHCKEFEGRGQTCRNCGHAFNKHY